MKRTQIEPDAEYAIKGHNGSIHRGFVLGTNWSVKGEYLGGHAPRAGGALVIVEVEGIKKPAPEKEARSYTESRYRALTAVEDTLTDDDPMAELILPPRGWTVYPVSLDSILYTWGRHVEVLETEAADRLKKHKTYRKLRTLLKRQVELRDQATKLGNPVATVYVERIVPATPTSRPKSAPEAPASIEVTKDEVFGYGRAVALVEAYMNEHYPDSGKDANMAAHSIVLDVAGVVFDEPRALSNRKQVIEVKSTKKALWERWRKGSDGNGYDWLGDPEQDPDHVIDVIMGLMVDRGWRPTVPSN